MIVLSILVAIVLVGGVLLRTLYRHRNREPALSCLAPNRSRGPNTLCQNPTPKRRYCSTHHDQHRRDNGAVWSASVLGALIIVAGIWLQVRS